MTKNVKHVARKRSMTPRVLVVATVLVALVAAVALAQYFAQWPYVKNLVPHNSLYNYARMQEVWLDK